MRQTPVGRFSEESHDLIYFFKDPHSDCSEWTRGGEVEEMIMVTWTIAEVVRSRWMKESLIFTDTLD